MFENTPFTIERYRKSTIALSYYGDSVLNSVCDMLFCAGGFFLAAYVPAWASAALVVAMELGVLLAIRDNLTLNILVKPAELRDALLFLGEAVALTVSGAQIRVRIFLNELHDDLGALEILRRNCRESLQAGSAHGRFLLARGERRVRRGAEEEPADQGERELEDPGRDAGTVEQLAGATDKRLALILLVPARRRP